MRTVELLQSQQARNDARLSELTNQLLSLQDAAAVKPAALAPAPVAPPSLEPLKARRPLPMVRIEPEPQPSPPGPQPDPNPDQGEDGEPTTQIVSDAFGELHAVPYTHAHAVKRSDTDTAAAAVQGQFRRALAVYQKGDAGQAFDQFDKIVRHYPARPEADDARFWMGECKFEMQDFRAAIKHFAGLQERTPAPAKAAEAMLKIGLSYEHLRDSDRARQTFSALLARFPKSASAELAQMRLAMLRAPVEVQP